MRRPKSGGRYSVAVPSRPEKNVEALGGAISYAQRKVELGEADTVYVRDPLDRVVAWVERDSELGVLTHLGAP